MPLKNLGDSGFFFEMQKIRWSFTLTKQNTPQKYVIREESIGLMGIVISLNNTF